MSGCFTTSKVEWFMQKQQVFNGKIKEQLIGGCLISVGFEPAKLPQLIEETTRFLSLDSYGMLAQIRFN